MQRSESIKEIATALCKAQAVMKAALRDSENPYFKSKYADFSSVWETCRQPLTSNGISVVQATDIENGEIIVETILMHTSGEWISGRLKITPLKQDPQAIGSAITYARRYALSGMVCLATEEDDDANKAVVPPSSERLNDKIKTETEIAGMDEAPLLTVDELCEKMTSAKNIFELKSRKNKYLKSYEALTPEEQVKVRMAADRRKTELEEAHHKANT